MTIEQDSERADELVEEIVKAWGQSVATGQAVKLSAEFKAMFEKCRRYRDAKRVGDLHRGLAMLSEAEAAEEKSARQAFLDAYDALPQKYPAGAS
jgi:hypothetical protein